MYEQNKNINRQKLQKGTKQILGLKCATTEMKNLLQRFNKTGAAGRRTKKPGDKKFLIIQSEEQEEMKKMK